MQPRPSAFHKTPPRRHIQNAPQKIPFQTPLHLHLIERPLIQTTPSTRVLHNSRRHRLINDVIGYALASYDHENVAPDRLALSCAHDFAQDGVVWRNIRSRRWSGVSLRVGLRQGCRRGVFGLCWRLIMHVLQQHLVGLLDLEEGEGE